MDPIPPRPAELIEQGLWSRNVGLTQLLGLCPLLAVSGSAVNALGLGLATVLCLSLTGAAVAGWRRLLSREIRIPALILLIACVVTAVELLMHAFLPALHAVLGIFVPLIVTNCALMARAEAFARRHDVGRAALDGAAMGCGFLLVLLLLGGLRELLGQGSLFADAGRLLHLPLLELRLPDYRGPLLLLLPPGAFLLLGLLVAGKQAIDQRRGASR